MTKSLYLLNWRLVLYTTLCLVFLFTIFTYHIHTNPFFKSFSVPPPELPKARVAVCLVGGARRFELTGPSIVKNVLEHYPNSDLFLLSPLDQNAFKLSLMRDAPRIASVRIFDQKPINVTPSAKRVLDARSAPRGIQGLLQYFNLVEGCLTLIQDYQKAQNFTYDWVVRTRVDGYWSAPLDPETFVPGQYSVPIGSNYLGANDRLGLGDLATSAVALSRLSLLPEISSAGFRNLNSESSYRAQFRVRNVSITGKRFPFCVVSDRRFGFPPRGTGNPVPAISSRKPLNGAYCRPCAAACGGETAVRLVEGLRWDWSRIESGNGTTLELCDPRGPWAPGWEERFDAAAGEKLAAARKRIVGSTMEECEKGFREMEGKATGIWDVPSPETVCRMGLRKSR